MRHFVRITHQGELMKTSIHSRLLLIIIILALLLAACGTPAESNMLQSNLRRVTSPNIPADDSQTLVDGNNAFALDIYQTLRSENGNLILSPFSISLALA